METSELTILGHCPDCGAETEADPVDVLFDLRPSCSKCGSWLESLLTVVSDGQRMRGERD